MRDKRSSNLRYTTNPDAANHVSEPDEITQGRSVSDNNTYERVTNFLMNSLHFTPLD